ncbi:CaiB/BaiF CoA-transferase family protein [Halorubrum sp. PV6]|uniref:CaiB/BaiF CoA transferase family protein n=1 Tax=Halorubrum sp. PV6 TaxID=634157 RepID=UPI000F852992|nr:CoA transferase [Halorubrum sp. PV6]AZQ15339.1 CoA transferase [Halorubrum sp. PV6]
MSRDAATDGGADDDADGERADATSDDDSDTSAGPLDGLTVVEAGSMISIGTVGRLLADFGADVIKVEHPATGDHLRHFGPQKEGVGLWWKYLGRNKQSVTLDISTEEGKVVFEDLVADADALIENFRPGTLERWDLGYDHLSELNPGLVMLRLSGFGQTGPYSDRPGFGTLAEAMSGFAFLNGYPDREPLLPPTGLADGIAAMFSTMAVAFALYNRDANGGSGQYIDTSLIEPIFSLIGPQPLRYQQLGEIEERSGNRSTSSAPRNVYQTGDGRAVAISASAQPIAMRVFDAIERPDLKDDPRFADNEKRLENVEELDAAIQDWMDDHTREEVIDRFEEYEATIAPIYNVADILDDEHYQARDAVVEIPDDEIGIGAVQNTIPHLSETPGSISHLGPPLGAHNEAVYGERLSYDEETLAELDAEGVI